MEMYQTALGGVEIRPNQLGHVSHGAITDNGQKTYTTSHGLRRMKKICIQGMQIFGDILKVWLTAPTDKLLVHTIYSDHTPRKRT